MEGDDDAASVVLVQDENDGARDVYDYDAIKQRPIVDCTAFKELNRTEEFKNLLDFLDNIEIDKDGNSFSFVTSPLDGLKEPKKDTDSTVSSYRSHSKQYTPNNSSFVSIKNEIKLKQIIHVIPPTDPKILEIIDCDANKIISINGTEKEVRFYDQTAITFMNSDDPREVYFEGSPVNIIIDDTYSYSCSFNSPDIGFILDGQLHKMHLGLPTQELYIDGNYYSCSFNGDPIQCVLNNVTRSIKIVGNQPSIVIGNTKRQDLVAGISHIIVDSFHPVIVYLDAKPQCIEVGQTKLILRFVDQLLTVLINNQPFKVDYDGEPLEIYVQGLVHFLKFPKLPSNIQPGSIVISEMLNIAPTEYIIKNSCLPSSPTTFNKTLKEEYDSSTCLDDITYSATSLSVLQSLHSDLTQQLINDQNTPRNIVYTNNVSADVEHKLTDNLLYDPWDSELEITFTNFNTDKCNISSSPSAPKPKVDSKRKKCRKKKNSLRKTLDPEIFTIFPLVSEEKVNNYENNKFLSKKIKIDL